MSVDSKHLASTVRRSTDLVNYRRLNWSAVTFARIYLGFREFAHQSKSAGVPFDFRLEDFDPPNEGVIKLTPAPVNLGIVNRKMVFGAEDSANDRAVFEQGGELVASQSVSGHVFFIAHQRHSDRVNPIHKEIILLGPLDPSEVTPKLVSQVLKKYTLVLRSSSIFGMNDTLSIRERMQIQWIYLCDIRERNLIILSVLSMKNEWAKLIFAFSGAIVGALIVFFYTAIKS